MDPCAYLYLRYACILAAVALVTLSSHVAVAENRWELGGRLQIDAARFESDLTPISDDVIIRRARLDVTGEPWDDWTVKLQYEFTDSELKPKSLWIAHQWADNLGLRLGHFKEPFGLQQTTSSKYNTFMERALPNVFSPGYHVGASVHASGEHWLATAGLFGGRLVSGHTVEQEGEALVARVVFMPTVGEGSLLHVGASVEQRRYPDGYTLRLRERPESRVLDLRFVDTGRLLNVEDSTRYALEWAAITGPVSFQAEYSGARITRAGRSALNFSGWYGQASWFVTGETRRYRDGSFRSVRPLRNSGALEFAVRFSSLDLSDMDVSGGTQENISLAVNWYVRERVRLSLNHIWVDAGSRADTPEESPRILQLRFQLYR